MPNILERLAQNYVSKLSKDEIMALAVKTDTTIGMKNSHLSQEDYPTPKSQYVHRHILIKDACVHLTNIEHRQKVAYYHPWVRGYLEKVSKALWSEPPIFCKPSNEDDNDPNEDEQVKTFWNENRLQEAVKKAWYKSQVHGICFYYPYQKDAFFNGYSGPPWYIYSMDELGIPAEYMQGHPIRWAPNHSNVEKTTPTQITISEGVFYDYKLTDDFTGEPFFLGIWDSLIDWIWITDAINAFDQRMGNGFMLMVVPNNTSDPEMTEYKTTIANTRTEKGIVVRGSVDEPVQIEWVGMAGMQVDFISHLEKLEDMFAFNMGFPKRWIMGDAEGAMESSGKDALQVNIQLKNLFSEWTLFIKRILLYHNQISGFDDITIKPPFELQLSEQEQVELKLKKAEIIATKTWLSVDEQRLEDGYDASGEEGADRVMLEQQNLETEMEQETQYNDAKESTTSKADTYELIAEIFANNQISVRQLADMTGVSPTTISKIREKIDADRQPHWKQDELLIKADAMKIDEDIYEIKDVPVVLPQKIFYPEYKRTFVRPVEEIQKIFQDPTYPKEFRIGVTPTKGHETKLGRTEIPNENTVGTVKFNRLDEHGNIRANIRYNLKEADRILGKDNFIRQKTIANENISTSVALLTRDRPVGDDYVESDLDIRSFVFTDRPRNEEAGK